MGGCKMEEADVAEAGVRNQGVCDGREVEEGNGGRRGRGGYG